MDIFAHTLWTAAGAKAVNKNKKFVAHNRGPLKVWHAGLWGIFPDLFAFTIPFIVILFYMITGHIDGGFWTSHGMNFPVGKEWVTELPVKLYNISHSAVMFLTFFLIVWAIRKRPYYEMTGWLLHILIDIPSHTANFYATPVFWPLSNAKFQHGVSWANPTYMIINYTALVLVWGSILYFKYQEKKKLKTN